MRLLRRSLLPSPVTFLKTGHPDHSTNRMEPQSYWFHLDDHVRWLGHLESEGFCVVKGAAKAEAGIALPLFWDFLCAQGAISRGDPATWLRANGWPGGGRGFIVESGAGGCHSPAAWALRGAPGVKAAFARIWDTQELLVSFDTFIAWRPWMGVHAPSEFHPVVEGLHLDQNPFSKRGRQCVQGMIPCFLSLRQWGAWLLSLGATSKLHKIYSQHSTRGGR